MNIIEGNTYFNKNTNDTQFKYLSKNIKTNILIVGGGITGLITAYHLYKYYDVTLIEKGRLASLSTSITTSLIQYELDDNIDKLKLYYTEEELKEIYMGCFDSINEIKEICDIINCEYQNNYSFLYTKKDIEKKDLNDEFLFRKSIGLNVKLLNKDSENFKLGILSDNAISFNPYDFSIKLSLFLKDKINIYENTKAVEVDYQNNICITNYNYKILFSKLICATGYDIKNFSTKELGNINYTYNIVTNKLSNILYSDVLIRDNKNTYNYYRVHNNRIIAGGYDTKDYNNIIALNIYEQLLNDVKRIYKNNDIQIEYKYSGIFKSTKDNLGYFGRSSNDKLFFALGYGANGIVFANIGGKIILDELNNKENNLSKYFKVGR